MRRLIWIPFLALICAAILAACDSADAGLTGPTPPPSLADAENVARAFLDAWGKNDYATMYGYLSPKSLQMSQEDFTKVYVQADETMRLDDKNGKTYQLLQDKSERQGTTSIIHYDMSFNSRVLGTFTDPNRTMRLIITPKGWRIAWSTMDIFEGWAGDATLEREIIMPPRGIIYDRSGKVIAQDDVLNHAIKLVPGKYPTGRAQDCFDTLGEIFHVSAADLAKAYGKFTEAQYGIYGFVIGHLSDDEFHARKSELDANCKWMDIPQTTRFYYSGSLAQQVVGYIADIQPDQQGDYSQYPQGTLIGQQGIEQYYQQQLAGEPGAQLVIKTHDGLVVRSIQAKKPGVSQDVTLSIDRDLQLQTEQALAGAYSVANWAQFSTGAAAVVLDVNSGDVLAMASYPSFDPDAFLRTTAFDTPETQTAYQKAGVLRNRATLETYALGSVFKIISMAAAANPATPGAAPAFKLTQTYTCTGTFPDPEIAGGVRKDWIYLDQYVQQKYHGTITLIQALTSSCDDYFWQIGKTLNGIDAYAWRKYANQMGVGIKTGIDTIAEQDGYVPDPTEKGKRKGEKWGVGDSLNTVIGQGDVQVTPIQVARMITGIANGGTLYRPTLVQKVGAPDQAPSYTASAPVSTSMGLDPDVIKGIQQGMCDVVSDKIIPGTKKQYLGTAHFVFYNWDLGKISVCGKTGTAQTGLPQPNGWFAAYVAPVNPKTGEARPELAIVVIVEHSREGSETAGPIVRRIIESHYKLPLEPWPDFWTGDYVAMTDPNASDGAGGAYANR